MRRTLLTLAFLAAVLARAEIIDGIAVTVDDRVITQSGILREIRITALLNGDRPDFSPELRRKTADRMVEQAIIRHEMDVTRYPGAEDAEVKEMLDQVKEDRFHNDEIAYQAALKEYGVEEAALIRQLARQAATLKFVELRFRPEVQLSETEVRDYYEKEFLPAWRKENPGQEPAFDELRPDAEQALAAQRVDKLVDDWMKQARQRLEIRYREEAFR